MDAFQIMVLSTFQNILMWELIIDYVNHLDGLGEAILECLLEAQGATHKHRDTATAWRIFVSWFVDVLKDGFQDSVRQNRRATLPVASWATTESSTSSSSTDDLKRAAMTTSSTDRRLSFIVEKFV
uniref:Uncharacterized protein n=1 Tax=Romanomermis culicivorax TaxID=13658 RepID=A0A915ICX7_ROMCU